MIPQADILNYSNSLIFAPTINQAEQALLLRRTMIANNVQRAVSMNCFDALSKEQLGSFLCEGFDVQTSQDLYLEIVNEAQQLYEQEKHNARLQRRKDRKQQNATNPISETAATSAQNL